MAASENQPVSVGNLAALIDSGAMGGGLYSLTGNRAYRWSLPSLSRTSPRLSCT